MILLVLLLVVRIAAEYDIIDATSSAPLPPAMQYSQHRFSTPDMRMHSLLQYPDN
jgi:hypothetical protein